MKKLFFVTLTFVFIIASIFCVGYFDIVMASINKFEYAQVVNNGVYLKRFPTVSNNLESKLFLLEPSYFVKILGEEDNFFKVEYLNVVGYVNKVEVCPVSSIPQNPNPSNITFSILNSSTFLREQPVTENNVVKILEGGTKNLTYLGKIAGEESLSGSGNIWYYCKQTLADNSTCFGYVYSPLCTNLSVINQNTEQVSLALTSPATNLTSENLILIVCFVPSLIMIFLLTKPTKIANRL